VEYGLLGEAGGGVFDFGIAEGGGVGLFEEGGEVDAVAAGFLQELHDVVHAQTSGGEDLDASGGLFDELLDERRAIGGKGSLAAGEEAGDAEVNELFEGVFGIGDDVEAAVTNFVF